MKKFTKYSIIVLCLFLFFTIAGFSQDLKSFEKRMTEYSLDNGLKLLILERHNVPVVSFLNYVDVGSVNEVYGITGIAHMFEHMAFKGTNKIGTSDYESEKEAIEKIEKIYMQIRRMKNTRGEIDEEKLAELEEEFKKAQEEAGKFIVKNEFGKIIEREGGRSLNASTSWDATRYFFSLPANKIELWFYLESERFLHPVFREFYKERDVVQEERRLRTESQPVGKLIEEFVSAAYKTHPYRHPVVGNMSDLQSFTMTEAREFYNKYYVPGNITVAVVGDVKPKDIIKLADKYFGRLKAGPMPPPVETVEPEQISDRIVKLYDTAQPIYLVGYHKPNILHKDTAVFDAITDIMGAGRTSRLYKRLVRDDKIALAAGAFTGLPGEKYPGLFIFYAFPNEGHTNEEVADAIDEEIHKLQTELVTDEELKRVKTRARAGIIRALDSNMGLAFQLTFYEVITGDWRNLFKDIEKIDKVTKEDIRRVAKEYFSKPRTVAMIVNKEEENE